MKQLFFIHYRNLDKAGTVGKNDKVIFLDREIDSERSLKWWIYYITNKENQNIHEYKHFWIQEWAFHKRNRRKSFAEELIIDNKTLWYPIEYFWHSDASQMKDDIPIGRVLLYIDTVHEIIESFKPERIVIENSDNELNKIIPRISNAKGIPIKQIGLKELQNPLIGRIINTPITIRAYLRARIFLRKFIGRIFCSRKKPRDIVILTNDRLTNGDNSTDFFWGPIVKELQRQKKNYKLVEYDRLETANSLINVFKRYIPQKYDAQYIGTYYDQGTNKYFHNLLRFMKKKFSELDKDRIFKDSLNYRGINFYDLVRPRLKKILCDYAIYIADVYAITNSVFKIEHPNALLLDHEQNFYARALMTHAKKTNTAAFCMDAEFAFGNSTGMTYIPEMTTRDINSPLWRPLPKMKFLIGEFARRWHITRNFFPDKSLVVTGSPKYDFLTQLGAKNKAAMRQKYNIKTKDALVVVLTVIRPEEEDYIKAILRGINNANKSSRDGRIIKCVIKMHPVDPIMNLNKWVQTLKTFNVQGTAVLVENTSELIHAADVVVTYPSMAVYECILLNKKTLLFGDLDTAYQPYVKEGLISAITKIEDLEKAMHRIDLVKSMNNYTRMKFIRKYLHSDKGDASKLVVSEILKNTA